MTPYKTFQDIKNEYDFLFKKDRVQDEIRAYKWHAQRLLKYCSHPRDVLDVACGGGFFLNQLNQASDVKPLLTGTDISSEALKIAQRQCPGSQYVLSVAEAMPFKDHSFDAITCLGSLEHFLDIKRAIQEMRRIMRQDGLFYIMVPNQYWYKDIISVALTGDKKDRNQTQELFASLGEWRRILEDAGLRIKKVDKYNGIARSRIKQWFKDILIPKKLSYHFIFICE